MSAKNPEGACVAPGGRASARADESALRATRSICEQLLRRGRAHESRGELRAALACHDEAITLLAALPAGASFDDARSHRRLLALACMNRGNALQKCHPLGDTSTGAAVSAYDQAIALLAPLVAGEPADHALRNSLGAAYLNRASTLLRGCERPRTTTCIAAALASADCAIATLNPLPLEENSFFRANLAGAHLNRAGALLATDLPTAKLAARNALDLVSTAAANHAAAAQAALGASRTLLAIIGRELSPARGDGRQRVAAADLLAEAGDLIDDGLALARIWDARRVIAFRPAAAQLFRAGAMLYASHQPHFLAEFLRENRALARELPAVVPSMLARARRTAHERCLVAGAAEPVSRTIATLAELSTFAVPLPGSAATTAPFSA